MIERTKQLVEDKYNIKNGFKHDSKVGFFFFVMCHLFLFLLNIEKNFK